MADAVDDTMMNDYLAESREHLADIESDLLTMEGAGANIDEALVNKVFRAAHSIKGGAGFFALHKIQELAHKMENVLQMVRAREMTPTPEVINILLLAFDKLREMINDAKASNQADVTEFVVALTGLASAHLAPEKKGSLTANADVTPRGVTTALKASEFDLARARREGQYVYLVEYDLIHDLQRQCKSPLEVVRSIAQCGTIFDCGLALEAGGTLDDEPDKTLPMQMLVGTVLEPHLAADLFEVGAEHVHLVLDITAPEKAASSVPASSAPPSPPPPRPPVHRRLR